MSEQSEQTVAESLAAQSAFYTANDRTIDAGPDPWYVVITRMTMDLRDMESIVIGPFDTEAQARDHGQDSLDVEDWVTSEAKEREYIVDDVFWTQKPEIPSYGINAPVF